MSNTKSYYFPPEGDSTPPTHDMQIIVQSRDVYGVTKVYPVCKYALHFAAIAGTTTLTTRTLTNILALGYGIIYE
jgi:hypothetical protein